VRREAARVRGLATAVGATREIAWHSRAATAFRDRVGEREAGLHRVALVAEAAADAIEEHARSCERRATLAGGG
jgi:hypothetical protein